MLNGAQRVKLGVFVLTMLAVSTANAAVNIYFDPGTTNTTTALTGFSTSGDQMAGMNVAATFGDNTTQSATWATTGPGAGGASIASFFSLSESGDTFGAHWILSTVGNTTLKRLVIDAGPGNTVFDTDTPWPGTPGSESGWTFELTSMTNPVNLNVYYRDLVALTPQAPVGDLYRRLDIQFTNAWSGSLEFIADTDNIKFAGDIKPLPLPAAVWAGLALLGALGIRRKMVR